MAALSSHREESDDTGTHKTRDAPSNVSADQSVQYNSFNTGSGTVHNYGGITGNVTFQQAKPDPNQTHWVVRRWHTRKFTGRNDESRSIEDALLRALDERSDQVAGVAHCYVIWGLGGQGKSELCLHMAHKLRNRFWGVFWVDASTKATVESHLSDIALDLSLHSNKPAHVVSYLATVQKHWLLVIDNADDIEMDYQPLLPPSDKGIILITSRNHDCTSYATLGNLELLNLGEADARVLLTKTADMPQEQAERQSADIDAVAKLLGYHTLGLIQAGTYVGRRYCTFAQYPEHFERYRERVLSFGPSVQASPRYATVFAAFEASFARLENHQGERYKDAIDLLELLSALRCNAVALPLFEAVWNGARAVREDRNRLVRDRELNNEHVDALISLIQPDSTEWDPFRLQEACSLLDSLSIVSFSSNAVSGVRRVSMHVVTHTWARMRLQRHRLQELCESAGSFLAFTTRDANSWPAPEWVDISEFAVFNLYLLLDLYSDWRDFYTASGFESDSLSVFDMTLLHALYESTTPNAHRISITFSGAGITFQNFRSSSRWMVSIVRQMRELNSDTVFVEAILNWLRSLNTTSSLLEGWPASSRDAYLVDHPDISALGLFQRMKHHRSDLIADFCCESAACQLKVKQPSVALERLAEARVMIDQSNTAEENKRRWLHYSYRMSAACVAAERWEEAASHLGKCQSIIHASINPRYLVVRYSLRPIYMLLVCCNVQDARLAVRLLDLIQEEQSGAASPSCPKTCAKGVALTASVMALRRGDLGEFDSAKQALQDALTDAPNVVNPSEDLQQYLAESLTNAECWEETEEPHALEVLRETTKIAQGTAMASETPDSKEDLERRLHQWEPNAAREGAEQGESHECQQWDARSREKWVSYITDILQQLLDRQLYPMLTG